MICFNLQKIHKKLYIYIYIIKNTNIKLLIHSNAQDCLYTVFPIFLLKNTKNVFYIIKNIIPLTYKN